MKLRFTIGCHVPSVHDKINAPPPDFKSTRNFFIIRFPSPHGGSVDNLNNIKRSPFKGQFWGSKDQIIVVYKLKKMCCILNKTSEIHSRGAFSYIFWISQYEYSYFMVWECLFVCPKMRLPLTPFVLVFVHPRSVRTYFHLPKVRTFTLF